MKKILYLLIFFFLVCGCDISKQKTDVIFKNEYLEVQLTNNGVKVEDDQITFTIEIHNKSNQLINVNGQTLPISGKIEYTYTINQSVVEEKNGHYFYHQENFYSYDIEKTDQEHVNLEIELDPSCFK